MRASYECDLHTHTNRSDGADDYFTIIKTAAGLGLKVLGITDHDVRPLMTMEGDDGRAVSVKEYALQLGLLLLPGIEISCNTEVEDVHIIGYGCDFSNRSFDELEQSVAESKIISYKQLCRRLTESGMAVSWDEVLSQPHGRIMEEQVQKMMIFELMAQKGYMSYWQSAQR